LTGILLALTLLVTASPSPTAAFDGSPSRAALLRMQLAIDAMVADGTPGMYVLIRHGSRVTELRSGRPNVNSERPWTDRSRFRVGSVTKTFVAAVIMQLVGEGRLRLSDSVERWLPTADARRCGPVTAWTGSCGAIRRCSLRCAPPWDNSCAKGVDRRRIKGAERSSPTGSGLARRPE
jgi:CubicO group peptidase (beta-lactamase class C family)